ncbi:MAG: hypothetical protein A2277_09785 [Desulfobacterales bacterium RIFOXYA12_FULL_46_15]|nr:MAG: hypothetical protein A2277_09785 [Desulfobacterales bacterium RIFOXYA12_FULL_46_15]
MPFKYSMIRIFTSEDAVCRGNPVYKAVVQYISGLKIAARCLVTRCMEGCYENGEIATQSILIASFNMPVVIKIILPSAQAQMILPTLEGMIDEDIMTPNPKSVLMTTLISEVVYLLLSSIFTGVPVIDKNNHPAGIISQGDLIYRGGMPARLGLLAESGKGNLDAVLESLCLKKAQDIMSPAVCIKENELLTEAVARMFMLSYRIHRLKMSYCSKLKINIPL